jgi:uncharacterized protein (TIGR02391 family)
MASDIENTSQEILLSVVRDAFDRDGKWPTRQWVEAVLDQDHYLDLEETLQAAPRSLVYATGTQEDSEVVLTVAGLHTAGAERDVRRFIQALGWCVDAQLGFRPTEPNVREEVRLEVGQFESEWVSRGERVSKTDLTKLRAMFVTEGIYSSIGGEDKNWEITLNRRRALPYRGVRTIEKYLAVKEASMRAPEMQKAPATELRNSEAPSEITPPTPHPEKPHPRVRQASSLLFAQGHLAQGVLEAIKVMRDILRERSQLDLDGEKLVSAALGPNNPRIAVADLETETGKSRQRGVMMVALGIFAGVRNPVAHDQIVVPPAEARQVMAMIGFVLEAVEASSFHSAAASPGPEGGARPSSPLSG